SDSTTESGPDVGGSESALATRRSVAEQRQGGLTPSSQVVTREANLAGSSRIRWWNAPETVAAWPLATERDARDQDASFIRELDPPGTKSRGQRTFGRSGRASGRA